MMMMMMMTMMMMKMIVDLYSALRRAPLLRYVSQCIVKRNVFSADRKDPMLSDGSRRWSGSRFQTIGPATENARQLTKHKRFQRSLELSEGDVQLPKLFWQTVPQRWPGDGKTAVTELVAWSLDQSRSIVSRPQRTAANGSNQRTFVRYINGRPYYSFQPPVVSVSEVI